MYLIDFSNVSRRSEVIKKAAKQPRRFRKNSRRPKRSLAAAVGTFAEISGTLSDVVGSLANREWSQLKRFAQGVSDELVSVLIFLNLYPLGLVDFDRLQVLSSVVPRRPILLIHGYFHNNSVFYILKRRLYREGWKHIYTINLRTHSASVEECAQEIQKKVDEIIEDTGSDSVDLISHSLGGLCARYYVQSMDGKEKVKNCITVGTPHRGSNLAFFGLGPSNLDMLPESDLLLELNEELRLPEGVEFTNIWSPFDYMIMPIESAIMEGRVRNIQVDYVGHMGLLFSRKVFNDIFLALSSDSIVRKVARGVEPQSDEKSTAAQVGQVGGNVARDSATRKQS